jgi:hypothetical protein
VSADIGVTKLRRVEIHISEEQFAALTRLASSDACAGGGGIQGVIDYLLHCCADGVRRPGSWERQWLAQAFGEF